MDHDNSFDFMTLEQRPKMMRHCILMQNIFSDVMEVYISDQAICWREFGPSMCCVDLKGT